MRASGKQQVAAVITFLAYWAIGIPVTCLMIFKFRMGAPCIWVGLTISCGFNTLAYLIIIKRVDWDVLIAKTAA